MRLAASYLELEVYKEARNLAQGIYEITKRFPKVEMYVLIDQVRRSSRSIGANIAETWAKRRYEAHFVSKLTDADGEQQETQHWINTALDCKYIDEREHACFVDWCKRIGGMLGSLMAKADTFCIHV